MKWTADSEMGQKIRIFLDGQDVSGFCTGGVMQDQPGVEGDGVVTFLLREPGGERPDVIFNEEMGHDFFAPVERFGRVRWEWRE